MIEGHLADRVWLIGDEPTGADAYLFWGAFLLKRANPDLPAPNLLAFYARYKALAHVRPVLGAEMTAYQQALTTSPEK